MPQFFSNKRLIVLLVSIILLVALIGYSMSDRRSLTWPEQFMKDSVGWVQSTFNKPAHYVAGLFENLDEMRNLYEENRILKAHLDDYAQIAVEVNVLRRQNDQLKEALDIEESLFDHELKPALVIHRSPDRWNEFIGVNKGEQHGVEVDMAVITSKGLVGKVNNVSQFTSTVQLLTDHDRTNRISAMVDAEDTEVYGFIEGYDEQTGALMLRKIEADAKIEVGQTVITSGLGGIFPKGLLIGEVMSVEADEYGLTKNAYIEPSASFHNLDYVLIVKRGAPTIEAIMLNDGEGD
ncbi:rod shape-determining protein MreC [Anaerobacillus arseniciselenatis]|uniref:Cell shape-determining protein MreC n=1 Tax=Anaerobacillus arseniciselenatis TaxID=85682 RepID=A0A1S2LEX2_9BACI|nr:rod shape-determining protein MreC [Anaerobacillus arseniciselenatis]OIJ10267.1 rod shape-determining protein MreC [Anaerobacillus arseniciselenatis]